MKNSRSIIILLLFILTLILNYFYGSYLYSKITNKGKIYEIGQVCSSSLKECENRYFKKYVDKINALSEKNTEFFADIIIKEDRKYYSGNCPCPYDRDVRGSSCGGRSSYSKNGQISYCYSRDVTNSQIRDKRKTSIQKAKTKLNSKVKKYTDFYYGKYLYCFIIIFYIIIWFYFRDKNDVKT